MARLPGNGDAAYTKRAVDAFTTAAHIDGASFDEFTEYVAGTSCRLVTIVGASNKGKTLCAVGAVQVAIAHRWMLPPDELRFFYSSALEAVDELERNRFNDESTFDVIIKNAGLLVLDDFGYGMTEKQSTMLAALVCVRSDKGKVTFLTCGSLTEMQRVDARFARRVIQGRVIHLGA